jgi:hypothetical protein
MCHCECSIRIHVRICKRNIRILVRIWNLLSLSISCDWQVLFAYSLLNCFLWIRIRIWNFFIAFVDCVLYIIYNIFNSNKTPMCYSNIMRSRLLEPTLHFYILYPRLLWQWLWDNNPSSFLQARLVLPTILLNMNMLKITNDVLWWIRC